MIMQYHVYNESWLELTSLSLVKEQNELLSRFTDLSENKQIDNLNAIVVAYVSFISSMSCENKLLLKEQNSFY